MMHSVIGTFARIHLAMEHLIASMPEETVLALKTECESLTRINCPYYEYCAAQWIKPHVYVRVAEIEKANSRKG